MLLRYPGTVVNDTYFRTIIQVSVPVTIFILLQDYPRFDSRAFLTRFINTWEIRFCLHISPEIRILKGDFQSGATSVFQMNCNRTLIRSISSAALNFVCLVPVSLSVSG